MKFYYDFIYMLKIQLIKNSVNQNLKKLNEMNYKIDKINYFLLFNFEICI